MALQRIDHFAGVGERHIAQQFNCAGFDVDFDLENDFYVVNAIPFHYDHTKHPIKFKVNEKIRVFLVNILEFDAINSFHLHANFFNYYTTGTSQIVRVNAATGTQTLLGTAFAGEVNGVAVSASGR